MSTEHNRHPEEIRFAVVLNGGVSLAVWMGGVVLELDRLTRATKEGGDPAYHATLDLVGGTARADVITGTSAGGINGAALALSQVNRKADLSALRDMWVEHGRFDELLRQPFKGQPPSLLRGDEYFLPRLTEALGRLTDGFAPVSADEAPIDLRITTTLLNGVPKTSYDDLGQKLTQTVHQGSFSFRRDPPESGSTHDDFAGEQRELKPHLVARLALAARSTASFPFAFEPSYVPVPSDDSSGMGANASWHRGDRERSRFAVDGGVLVNTPTKEALEAIDRMPAQGRVRRVMLLVFPHAPSNGDERQHDKPDGCPSVLGTGGKLLGALYSQSGRTYVDRVEEHNRTAASRRIGRNALLNQLHGEHPGSLVSQVYQLAGALYGQYKDVRIRYAAKQLAGRLFDSEVTVRHSWSFERTRTAAEAAQREWAKTRTLPYVPRNPPPLTVLGDEGTWPWGFTMAERLASATLDLLKRLVWVLPGTGETTDVVAGLRSDLHTHRMKIRKLRTDLDADAEQTVPNHEHWEGRLDRYYQRLCTRGGIGGEVREAVEAIGGILFKTCRVLNGVLPDHDEMAGLTAWRALLNAPLTGVEAYTGLNGSRLLLSRLLALEISATCVGDVAPTGLDQPVELVQLSLQTVNPFAKYSRTPDDKAAGASLGRFSGFLKRSWRVNDWIWGRLDAATTLCQVVLSPERLHRQYNIEMPEGTDPAKAAEDKVNGLVKTLFGETAPPELGSEIRTAINELKTIYGADSADRLEPTAEALAKLVTWGLHMRIITEELSALKDAVQADLNDGANERSAGALFIVQRETLLNELGQRASFAPEPAAVERALAALAAFDQARIGREPLAEELTGDQMIRTAATAAAVTASVLDSDRSGLGAVKPVTRLIRGATLLPYWMVHGLTRGNRIAQAGGLLAIAIGAVMLMLAMFNLLPKGLIAPAAALGAGTLLAVFGYAALRSRTMLHGLVLLSPVVPLVTHAITAPDDTKSEVGAISLGGVAAVVIALMILGSIPAMPRTPFALIVDGWRVVLNRLVLVVAGLCLLWNGFLLAVLVVHLVRPLLPVIATVLGAVAVVAAAVIAFRQGKSLKRWQRDPDQKWKPLRADHPAAATAGWAVVYGVVFLATATVMWLASGENRHPVLLSALITAWVFAGVLLLITPWYVPMRARRAIQRTLAGESAPARLEAKGITYLYLLDLNSETNELVPRPSPQGRVRNALGKLGAAVQKKWKR
ncbi:patatin-like protein [Lentzea alba]|uniref:patatin-like protein n=1 Tax=Lentzea alba TaxID=2714351 RepID=UPI0039BF1FBD